MNMMIAPETKRAEVWGHSSVFNIYYKLNLPRIEITDFIFRNVGEVLS